MTYHLAQINIAKFLKPADDPVNHDFVSNLDRVNAIAERQPGFIWRLVGDGNNAMDVQVYDDPNVIVNLSVWTDATALANFVYRHDAHKAIMRRRKAWFDKVAVHQALWWIEQGRTPTPHEGRLRLELLARIGPTYSAFTFKDAFGPPDAEPTKPLA